MVHTFKTSLICAAVLGAALAAAPLFAGASTMDVIYEQSGFNPHAGDPVVLSEASLVRVESGLLRGSFHEGVFQYLGVPYAKVPERFAAPAGADAWEGVRDALVYGPQCPQYLFGTTEPLTSVKTAEDCLNLNIWTPSLGEKAKKPVMVWLHGGGFSSGSANEAHYDGENLSRIGDVVVVSVNHRLNALGHFDLSAYSEKYKNSANAGGLDLVAALKWISRNIERFGGDPDNVTIFGESGGGAKVLEMMSAPSAKGLFKRGIVESGATDTMGVRFTKPEISREIAAETLKNLNLSGKDVEKLQSLPLGAIWEASDRALKTIAERRKIPSAMGLGYGLAWEPVSGTAFLPTDPVLDKGFAKDGEGVSLMIGSNLTEWTTIIQAAVHKDMTAKQKALFAKAYPNEDPALAPYVDTIIRLPMLKIMSHKADQGVGSVYAYVFTKEIGDNGAYHTSEIPFVFSNTKEPSELSRTMSLLWASYARTGVPQAPGAPVWEPYTRQTGATMILDDKIYLTKDHDKALMKSLRPDYKY